MTRTTRTAYVMLLAAAACATVARGADPAGTKNPVDRSDPVAGPASPATAAPAAQPPNILFILADDLGWSDTTLYGATKFYETPQLERLARRGMTFSWAYAANPLCSPTRASIMTGLYPARIGITAPLCHEPQADLEKALESSAPPTAKVLGARSVTRLKTSYVTLAGLLQAAGYATGHFGKWHLGPEPYSALQHRFEVDVPHYPGPGPLGGYIAPWKLPEFRLPAKPGEHLEDLMAEQAIRFIRAHKEGPFFLNYWSFSVHKPFGAKRELISRYAGKIESLDPESPQRCPIYAAMVHSFDDAVGRLLDTLDELKIADRTVSVDKTVDEGPIGECTGYLNPGSGGPQPVFQVTAMTHRDQPILPVVASGEPIEENHTCWGLAIHAQVLWELRAVGFPVTACFSPFRSASHWLVVTVPESYRGQAVAERLVGELAAVVCRSRAGALIPKVILLADDIDPANLDEVVWAFAARCHPERGQFLFPDQEVLPLLAFLDSTERETRRSTKVIYHGLPLEDLPVEQRPRRSSFRHGVPPEMREKVMRDWRRYGYRDD